MEYDALVNFYVEKLRERYRVCNPERRRIMELLRHADDETIRRVASLLDDKEKQEGAPCSRQ